MTKYWLGVVSEEHVQRGVREGIAQLCHGKCAPLKKMEPGDWLVYYSPRTRMGEGEAIQAFTALGQVADNEIYQFQMYEDFIPFRRRIRYLPAKRAAIKPLLDRLSLTANRTNWGYALRRGHLEVTEQDFQVIAEAMGVTLEGM